MLNPSGIAQANVAIPGAAALVGVKVHGTYATFDLNGIRAIANPWLFQITA